MVPRAFRETEWLRIALCLIVGSVVAALASAAGERRGAEPPTDVRQQLTLAPFYKKCVVTEGLAIVGSAIQAKKAVKKKDAPK